MSSESDSDVDITINDKMTSDKLKFIKSSSISNFLSQDEKKAAEEELKISEKQKQEKMSSKIKKKKQPKVRIKKKQVESIIEEYDEKEELKEEKNEKEGKNNNKNGKPKRITRKKQSDSTNNNENIKVFSTSSRKLLKKSKKDEQKPEEKSESEKEERKNFLRNRAEKRRNKRIKQQQEDKDCGVLYLGHIPHGFYEKQIRDYFSQFGRVFNVRISRSNKTGRSRGYGFIKFQDKNVATVAADAMDGYLMHGSKLVAKVVPDENIHPDLFTPNVNLYNYLKSSMYERRQYLARSRNPEKVAERSKNIQKNMRKKKNRLAKLQIKYQFPEIPNAEEQSTVNPEESK